MRMKMRWMLGMRVLALALVLPCRFCGQGG